MSATINIIAWIIAIAAWVVILLSPAALVMLVTVGPWRRWWLRPLTRKAAPLLRLVTGRRRPPAPDYDRIGYLERLMDAEDRAGLGPRGLLDEKIQRRIIK